MDASMWLQPVLSAFRARSRRHSALHASVARTVIVQGEATYKSSPLPQPALTTRKMHTCVNNIASSTTSGIRRCRACAHRKNKEQTSRSDKYSSRRRTMAAG
eukprot:364787-Chlamydomonas_euryale.AAC.7